MRALLLALLFAFASPATMAESDERISLPVWRSAGIAEPLTTGFLGPTGEFLPLFRVSNEHAMPEGYWIEAHKWRALSRLVPSSMRRFGLTGSVFARHETVFLRIAVRAPNNLQSESY